MRYWRYPFWLYKEAYTYEELGFFCVRCKNKSDHGTYVMGKGWVCQKCKFQYVKCICGEDRARELGATGGKHSWWCPRHIKESK